MNYLIKFLFIASAFTYPAHAVFVAPGEYPYAVMEDNTGPFNFACKIETSYDNNTTFTGTGCLLNDTTCLTIRHVVERKNNPNPTIALHFFKNGTHEIRTVTDVRLCDLGQTFSNDPYDGPALLFFDTPIKGIEFPNIRSLSITQNFDNDCSDSDCEDCLITNQKNQLPQQVTIMGFGQGGSLNAQNIHALDPLQIKEDHRFIFRYVENIQGTLTIRDDFFSKNYGSNQNIPQVLENLQAHVKVGSGDSGGPLVDENGNVIGITQSGRNRIFALRNKVLESFSLQQRFFSALETVNRFIPGQILSSYIHNFYKKMYKASVDAINYDVQYMGVKTYLEREKPEIYFANCPEAAELKRIMDARDIFSSDLSRRVRDEQLLPKHFIEQWAQSEEYQEYMSDPNNHIMFSNTFVAITPDIHAWIDETIAHHQNNDQA